MKKFHYFILVLFVVFNCSWEDKVNDSNDREYITTCYKFVNKSTGAPIEGLSILIHYGNPPILSSQGITDSEGVWCFDHWNDHLGGQPYTYLHDQRYLNFPISLPMNGTMNRVELLPYSRIRFHIVNVEPTDESDLLEILVRFDISDISSEGHSNQFEGDDVDIYYNSKANKGVNTIEWKVYTAGNLVGSYRDEVRIWNYGDTVEYDIEY